MNNRWLAPIAFISGILISIVAAYFSILGLSKLFASAAIAVIIFGSAIEIGKLVSTSWLFHNWRIAPKLLKSYMLVAVVILMLITSLGIWGYLNKSYSDQTQPMQATNIELSVVRANIKIQEEVVAQTTTSITQLNALVQKRIDSTKGADTSLSALNQTRRQLSSYQSEQKNARAKLAELRQQEAKLLTSNQTIAHEVGPINYIATLIYGNSDPSTVDKAVQFVIILLVLVFDPLAIALLLAANFSWSRKPARIDIPKNEEGPVAVTPDELIRHLNAQDDFEKPTTIGPPPVIDPIVEIEEIPERLPEFDEILEKEDTSIGEVIYHDDGTKSFKG